MLLASKVELIINCIVIDCIDRLWALLSLIPIRICMSNTWQNLVQTLVSLQTGELLAGL
jgi:hypothetical protein